MISTPGIIRPLWAQTTPLLQAYYDLEWAVPVITEQGIFERMSLEAFQAGLSWRTILQKRESFRKVFYNFDPDQVAKMTDHDVQRLLNDASIVRNRKKIEATIHNAKTVIRYREVGSLAQLLWSFEPTHPLQLQQNENPPATRSEAELLSKALKSFGFKFVGPVTVYAMMCAIGIDNPHPVNSLRYTEIEQLRAQTRALLS